MPLILWLASASSACLLLLLLALELQPRRTPQLQLQGR